MKQNIKRVLVALLMMICIFSVSACSQKTDDASELDSQMATQLEQAAKSTLEQLDQMSDAQILSNIAGAEKSGDTVIMTAMQSWKSVREELGALVSVDKTNSGLDEDGNYLTVAEATFEKRTMEFRMGMKDDFSAYTLLSFNPTYTVGEKMTKAAMNTLMGMGTVFAVLIFISLLIGCFKYIGVWEQKMKEKTAAPVTKPIAVPVAVPATAEADPMQDLELMAVITAAVAAYESEASDASADSLVVRPVKRATAGKWKRS